MNIVLLHGLCESSRLWDELVAQLDNIPGIRFYIPDIPGFGLSKVEPQKGIDGMASYLLKDLSIRNINQFSVFGHSMGGYIALEMLAQEPERVTGVGLINSTAKDDDEVKRANRARVVKFIQNNGVEKYVKELAQSVLAPHHFSDQDMWNKVLWVMENNNDRGVINALESMAVRKDHTSTLKDCPKPVLMAGGRSDTILPPARIFDEAMLPITCTVELFEDAGHCLPIEKPIELAHMIRQFLPG